MQNTRIDHKRRDADVTTGPDRRAYPLGYSESELKRLERQGAFLYDLTEDVLRRAGIKPGMRVLDVGCGAGDVSILAGALVGSSGAVLGIDRSPQTVEIAKRRAAAAGQAWLRFAAAELDAFPADEMFDAVVGRFVLMYLPDPAGSLRRLCRHLRPGGILAFQEMVMPLARCVPDLPLFSQCRDWILDTFALAGIELDLGSKLFATFLAAGLPAPQMIAAGRVEGGPHSVVYDYVAGTLRSLLPAIERAGIATAAEVDIDSLASRLRREVVEHKACVMPPLLIGAWTEIPA